MKLTGARLERFLQRPDPAIPLVLFYGRDNGLVRERAENAIRAVVGQIHDPFRITELSGRNLGAASPVLTDEVGAMSLTGGRRVVRVREATDSATSAIEALLSLPVIDSLIIVEAGELGPRSSLRKFFETCDQGAAVPCYEDGTGDLESLIRTVLGADGIRIASDAMAFMVAHLGSDREVTRRELEKVRDYMGGAGEVGLEDAVACIGDSAATSLDSVVMAAADGDFSGLEATLLRVNEEGTSPVAILRAAGRHWQRLHFVSGQVAGGVNARDAMGKLRPPVFFFHRDRFSAQVRTWHAGMVAKALEWITDAESDCKTSGLPAAAICHRLLLRLAGVAGRERRKVR